MTQTEFDNAVRAVGDYMSDSSAPAPICDAADDIIKHAEKLQRDKAELLRIALNSLKTLDEVIAENSKEGEEDAPALLAWRNDIFETTRKAMQEVAS